MDTCLAANQFFSVTLIHPTNSLKHLKQKIRQGEVAENTLSQKAAEDFLQQVVIAAVKVIAAAEQLKLLKQKQEPIGHG